MTAHDAERAKERAERLKAVLQEAGAALYSRATTPPPAARTDEPGRDEEPRVGHYI